MRPCAKPTQFKAFLIGVGKVTPVIFNVWTYVWNTKWDLLAPGRLIRNASIGQYPAVSVHFAPTHTHARTRPRCCTRSSSCPNAPTSHTHLACHCAPLLPLIHLSLSLSLSL